MTHELVLATDRNNESAAFYLDGTLISQFDNRSYPHPSYSYFGPIEDALEELFGQPVFAGIAYREEPHHMTGFQCNGPFDPPEWDVEWPDRLGDTPVDLGQEAWEATEDEEKMCSAGTD